MIDRPSEYVLDEEIVAATYEIPPEACARQEREGIARAHAHHVDPERWWSWHGAPLLVFGEYDKYLFTWALPLLQLWWPPPPAGPPVRTTENSGAQSSPMPMRWR